MPKQVSCGYDNILSRRVQTFKGHYQGHIFCTKTESLAVVVVPFVTDIGIIIVNDLVGYSTKFSFLEGNETPVKFSRSAGEYVIITRSF